MTSLRPKATFGSILKYKHEICSMPTTKFPAVAAALCTILAAGSLSAKAPIFMPIKVDGPVHAPEKGSFWYGPFAEGSAVFDLNGDGWLDITCGRNWYEGPNWVKHTDYRENSKTFGEFQDNNGEVAYDVDRDGDTDLIGSGWMGNGIFWYENPGRPLEPGEQWVTHKIHDTEWTEGFMVADVANTAIAISSSITGIPRKASSVLGLNSSPDPSTSRTTSAPPAICTASASAMSTATAAMTSSPARAGTRRPQTHTAISGRFTPIGTSKNMPAFQSSSWMSTKTD